MTVLAHARARMIPTVTYAAVQFLLKSTSGCKTGQEQLSGLKPNEKRTSRGTLSAAVCECDVNGSRTGIGRLVRRVAHGLDAVREAQLEWERQAKSIPGIKVAY
ncbi:hypothetical protein NDU88_003320 [Pleurodeles waltl]|uniref:Uncharacterized protein n=1 Tax=Pleurodeles waltl TaxID=8319 RepID=A0AAV7WS21_PLEWA|nr:hypothetical protein NDU88_003320 [Pleurodeles waltl]